MAYNARADWTDVGNRLAKLFGEEEDLDFRGRLTFVEHTLRVAEGTPVLWAAEAAGLLPGSDCRRGRCLSCAARAHTKSGAARGCLSGW